MWVYQRVPVLLWSIMIYDLLYMYVRIKLNCLALKSWDQKTGWLSHVQLRYTDTSCCFLLNWDIQIYWSWLDVIKNFHIIVYVALYPYYTHITLPQSHESTLGPLPNFGDHMFKKARESDLKEHCSIVSPHVISIGKFYPVQKKKTPNSKTML